MPIKWTPEKKRQYARERYRSQKENQRRSGIAKSSPHVIETQAGFLLTINQQQDFWMDNAIENLYHLIEDVHNTEPGIVNCKLEEHRLLIKVKDQMRFLKSLERVIVSKRDSVLFAETANKGKGTKNVKLGYILMQYAKSSAGRNSVKEKMYDGRELHNRLLAGLFPKLGEKTCVLCSTSFDKRIDKLKQSVLPSVTKNAALSGTLSKDEYFGNICPTCYVLGALEWIDDRIIYRSQQDGESIALYPLTSDLLSLSRQKRAAQTNLRVRTLSSNLRSQTIDHRDVWIQGPYSALLVFVEQILESLSKRTGKMFDENSPLAQSFGRWICLRVPSGKLWNVMIQEIEIPGRILGIINQLDSRTQSQQSLRIYCELFSNFMPSLREELAESFLKDDFHKFSSRFIPGKRMNVYLYPEKWHSLDSFLSAWQLNEIGITGAELEKIKQAANLVAELNLGNISVFYNIERARNVGEFIKALQEASRKLLIHADDFASGGVGLNPTSLDSLLELITITADRWQIIRDALLIYTSMYYSIKRRNLK